MATPIPMTAIAAWYDLQAALAARDRDAPLYEVTLDGVPLTVAAHYLPGRSACGWEPPEPDEVDIRRVLAGGVEVSGLLSPEQWTRLEWAVAAEAERMRADSLDSHAADLADELRAF